MTGAIIRPWLSEPKHALKGTAGPGSATSFLRQVVPRRAAEATRAGPGKGAELSTQSSPAPVERVCCRTRAWLQAGQEERGAVPVLRSSHATLSGPRGSGSKGQLGFRRGRGNIQLKSKNQDKRGGRGVLKFGWNLFFLPSLLPSSFSSRW